MKRKYLISKLTVLAIVLDGQNQYLWASWCRAVCNALQLEEIFPEAVKLANKGILENIGHIDTKNIIDWCERTYNVYHPLRNNVETLDSIEEIRQHNKFAAV